MSRILIHTKGKNIIMRNFNEPELSGNERIVHMLIHVLHMHRAAAEKTSEEIGLYRSQHMMLKYLIHSPYEPTQKQIAEALEISPAAVAVTLKKLEAGGYISRKAFEGDNRCNRIVLTEQGRNVLELSRRRFSELDSKMLDGFSEEELDILEEFLERMKENLRDSAPRDRMPPKGKRSF